MTKRRRSHRRGSCRCRHALSVWWGRSPPLAPQLRRTFSKRVTLSSSPFSPMMCLRTLPDTTRAVNNVQIVVAFIKKSKPTVSGSRYSPEIGQSFNLFVYMSHLVYTLFCTAYFCTAYFCTAYFCTAYVCTPYFCTPCFCTPYLVLLHSLLLHSLLFTTRSRPNLPLVTTRWALDNDPLGLYLGARLAPVVSHAARKPLKVCFRLTQFVTRAIVCSPALVTLVETPSCSRRGFVTFAPLCHTPIVSPFFTHAHSSSGGLRQGRVV